MPNHKFKMPKKTSQTVLIVFSVILGVLIALGFGYYAPAGLGYVDRGYPLHWMRIYGGVTTQTDYVFLLADVAIWFAVCLIIAEITLAIKKHRSK